MKTCARFVHTRKKMKAGQPAPVTGVAQVGMSGVSRVQYWLCPHDAPLPKDDPYFTKAEWKDADVLPPPDPWGGGCRTAGCRQCHARLTLPPVNRTAGQFATRSLIGRRCFRPYAQGNTTFAAAQSMPTALRNLCRVRSPNRAITLSSKCESLLRSEFNTRIKYFAHVVRTACWARLVSDCLTRSGVMGS